MWSVVITHTLFDTDVNGETRDSKGFQSPRHCCDVISLVFVGAHLHRVLFDAHDFPLLLSDVQAA